MIKNTLNETLNSVWPMLTIFLVVIISVRIAYILINKEKFVFYKDKTIYLEESKRSKGHE